MPRTPTTFDSFNAIAEPKRRRLLELLIGSERIVGDLVQSLGWPQPQVSKHLGVLRKVGLVSVRRVGREKWYALRAQQLQAVHNWVKTFEQFWEHQLAQIKKRAENKRKEVNR